MTKKTVAKKTMAKSKPAPGAKKTAVKSKPAGKATKNRL
jgi:hypothetical protein